MEVSGQVHDLAALLPSKETPVIIEQEAGWALEAAWTFVGAETPFVIVGNRYPAHPGRGPGATPTTISPSITQKGSPQLLLFLVYLTTTLSIQIKEL
jgi:hypothetical protein